MSSFLLSSKFKSSSVNLGNLDLSLAFCVSQVALALVSGAVVIIIFIVLMQIDRVARFKMMINTLNCVTGKCRRVTAFTRRILPPRRLNVVFDVRLEIKKERVVLAC